LSQKSETYAKNGSGIPGLLEWYVA